MISANFGGDIGFEWVLRAHALSFPELVPRVENAWSWGVESRMRFNTQPNPLNPEPQTPDPLTLNPKPRNPEPYSTPNRTPNLKPTM